MVFMSSNMSLLLSVMVVFVFAAYFDRANDWLSLGWHGQWKALLAREMDAYGTDRVLDLSTGTGDVAIRLAHCMKDHGKMFGSSPSIVGVDPSVEMLRLAQAKLARGDNREVSTGYVRLQVGAAEGLSALLEQELREAEAAAEAAAEAPGSRSSGNSAVKMDDLLFDKVTISFGVRNFPDRQAGLAEVRRVTKTTNPNGKLAILEFVAPSAVGLFGWMAPLVSHYLYYGVPILGTSLLSFLLLSCPPVSPVIHPSWSRRRLF